MYNDVTRAAQGDDQDGALAEDYLLGKPVNRIDKEELEGTENMFKKKEQEEQFVSFGANDENEAFSRMVEDPLVQIRKQEMERRQEEVSLGSGLQIAKMKEMIE